MTYPQKKLSVYLDVRSSLENYINNEGSLEGISQEEALDTFCRQVVDSIRRVDFVKKITCAPICDLRMNPISDLFDPLKAAVLHYQSGNIDEAFWLVFLATHFGKSKDSGWLLCKDIYGGLGEVEPWTWSRIINNFPVFEEWYKTASNTLINDSTVRKFSNHRKYESLRFNANRNIPRIFKSYIDWVGKHRSHEAKLFEYINEVGADPKILFHKIYSSMGPVISFGRTGRFDLLTMIGKLKLANITPPLTYMKGATGPIKGANMFLFGVPTSSVSVETLESKLAHLNTLMPIGDFGMQVLEDALCNWQKNPTRYVYFTG